MKYLALFISLTLIACAGQEAKQVAIQGYSFSYNDTKENAVLAVVTALQSENLTITTINEKFGIVTAEKQSVPAAQVAKWRGDSAFGLGTTTWTIDFAYTIKESEISLKYCHHGEDFWTGNESCAPYKADVAAKYFESKILSELAAITSNSQ